MCVLVLAGCARWLGVEQSIAARLEWVPVTHYDGEPYRKMGLVAEIVDADIDSNVVHTWHLDWGDGSTEDWADNRYSWHGSGYYSNPLVYPYGNNKIHVFHEYAQDGTYEVSITVDDETTWFYTLEMVAYTGRGE